MYLIIGLGNPGRQYEHTRHNAGFDALDILSALFEIPIQKSKCRALVGEGVVAGERVVLAKPQTYMNDSGQSVVDLISWYKPLFAHVLVVYDDIDLPLGNLRMRKEGSAGTHNGMRSILSLLGKQDFPRLRIGIGRPEHPRQELKDFVLTTYPPKDRERMTKAFQRAAGSVDTFVKSGVDAAMQEANIAMESREDG